MDFVPFLKNFSMELVWYVGLKIIELFTYELYLQLNCKPHGKSCSLKWQLLHAPIPSNNLVFFLLFNQALSIIHSFCFEFL
jgi:hypothetical protein